MGRLGTNTSGGRLSSTSGGGRLTNQVDLSTSKGLYSVAKKKGGAVAAAANAIENPNQGLWNTVKSAVGGGLMATLDVLQRPNYAVASAVKNVIDKNPQTTFTGGLVSGIMGQTKNTFSDVYNEAGWKPTTTAGKVGKGIVSFASDVLFDPTTYITFGVGTGVKAGELALSKAGSELLTKGLKQGAGKSLGEQFVKDAIVNMANKSPELYKKFIDQGGIKFFGQTLISGGRIAGVVKAIPGMTKLDEATQPVRNSLYTLFHRDASVKYGKLPQEYIDISQKFRDLGYVRTEGAIKNVTNIATENRLTSQEAEIITNAIEHKLPLADTRLENVRKQMEVILGRNLKNEQRVGINTGELPNYVPHMLVDEPKKIFNFKPESIRVSTPFTKQRKVEGTIDEINTAFGKDFFDPNIVKTTALRSVASARAVTAKEFLQEISQKFGVLAEKAPSNYVDAGIKELTGLKFHPAIAESIGAFRKSFINDEATKNLLGAFDKIQSLWKASVTQLFPAFHGRNAISNVFLNFLGIGADAINPMKHALAANLLWKNNIVDRLERQATGLGGETAKTALTDILAQPILKDIHGKTWNFGDLRNVIRNNRVAFGNEFVGSVDVRKTLQQQLAQTTKLGKTKKVIQAINPLSTENFALKTGRAIGSSVEEQARLVNFLSNLQKTGDVTLSANRVKQFLFDYQNLSNFERNVMRRLIPFYTFTRKNLELQVKQFAKQPGKFTTQAKLFSSISEFLSGGELTDKEKMGLPAFLKNGLGIVTKRVGKKIEIVSSLGTPLEAVFNSLQKNQLLGSLSPALAVPLQVATQRNFFYDKPLDEVTDATAFKNAPDFIKNYIGYIEVKNKNGTKRSVALNPTRLFIISSLPPTTRVISSIRQLEQNNVSGKLKLLQQLTGIKPYGIDLEISAATQEKQKTQKLQELLDTAGVAPIFKRSFIPKK